MSYIQGDDVIHVIIGLLMYNHAYICTNPLISRYMVVLFKTKT